MQDIVAFEVAEFIDVKPPRGDLEQPIAQHPLRLLCRPNEVLTLFALAVGVLGREKPALGAPHLAQLVLEYFAGSLEKLKLVKRARRINIKPTQKRIVVEHLLEV